MLWIAAGTCFLIAAAVGAIFLFSRPPLDRPPDVARHRRGSARRWWLRL
jgi:hypothetical protein